MKDGPGRSAVKRAARAWFELELWARRGLRRARGQARFELAGECRRCARCCEAPSLQVGPVLWYFPTLQRLFLSWQRHVNGFELTGRQRESRVLVFRCSHFDRERRLCDSYHSRPGICRDYPRALLDQPWPELFDECGYRARDTRGEGLLVALRTTALPEEKRKRLERDLHL